ncbi:MAG: tRNA (adenosine(37)-N6)-threonylcarbamoyltransferase complex transferase subunit TsaD [Eubacterium sp.]|nr:tRNA (adenosine(37)-N6)-threonylcarbamoyltransferase complex transferase subunit TsaD [Eubacterium sp.]
MPKNLNDKCERFLTLAIESSCDETAAAVVADGRELLSNVISSQIETHTLYGGVVPEIASRQHLTNINDVISSALTEADITIKDIDLIAVTHGPGLIGTLVIGVAAAKALALANDIPLVGVNHMHGHICSNFISSKELIPPFVSLVVSGGHTNLIKVKDYTEFEVLGSTRDDAVGEAYDKVARVIGLGYPGGPKIDEIAKKGNPDAIFFKRVYLNKDSLDFSFSGIKTAVLNYVNTERQAGRELNTADIAAGFQEAVVEVLINKSVDAVKRYGNKKLVLAGGVAANSRIRKALAQKCEQEGIKLHLPEKVLCTDNAAMIACAGYYKYLDKGEDDLSLDAYADLPF